MSSGHVVYHRILAKHSGKCLDVSFAGNSNGDRIHQWECVCADNQLWEIVPIESGCFKMVAKHSGKCLDVMLAAQENDARVHQWDYVAGANQQWHINPVDNLYCKIMARHSAKCLQVGGVTYLGNGSEVNQLEYVDGENQKWLIVPDVLSFSNYFRIVNKQNLTDLGGPDRDNHLWRIVSVTDGQYRIESQETGECLEVAWEREDERITHGNYAGGENQKWSMMPAGRFSYRINSVYGGKRLQMNSDGSANAPAVSGQLASDNQLWILIPKPTGVLFKDGAGEMYLMDSDHRILIPDEDALKALGGESNSAVWIDDSELTKKPLWPFLRFDSRYESQHAEIKPLVKALNRVALWAGLSQIAEPVPHSAIGLLDIAGNKTQVPVGQFSLGGREEWEKRRTGVFLSHSSKDKPLARRIAEDLHRSGVYVWLDEWEIRVGDSITQEIQKGLEQTDFVAVLLSRHGVESGWVEKEWQSKIGAEAEQKKVIVLPLKCDDCVVPPLLKDKKYADFTRGYDNAFGEVLNAIQTTRARTVFSATEVDNSSTLRFITDGR